jgi:hypothetical protein
VLTRPDPDADSYWIPKARPETSEPERLRKMY